MPKYTPAESHHIVALRESGLSPSQIAPLVGRTPHSIRNFLYRIGMTEPKAWSEQELDVLRAEYESCEGKPLHLNALAARLGRTRASVASMASGLGLTDNKRPGVEARKVRRKYATAEEHRAALSAYRREWIKTHGHPRGALGMKHSEETKKKVGEAARRHWEQMTPERRERMFVRRNATNIERYGTGCPQWIVNENPYSRTRSGKREDLGGLFLRSAWEANYARYLNWLIEQGEIVSWEYEADIFIFHGETRGAITYRPDFKVTERDGAVVYHEVKGWMDGPSKTRLKRMKKYYPDVTVIVIGEDEYKAISKWRDLIPNWE